MLRYQWVEWHHDFADEPVTLVSEVDDHGTETRKVEIYRDGQADFADGFSASGSTFLSETPMPSVQEIEDHTEFSVSVITKEQCDQVWERARGAKG